MIDPHGWFALRLLDFAGMEYDVLRWVRAVVYSVLSLSCEHVENCLVH